MLINAVPMELPEISREQKKALNAFRTQVQYKDYRGLEKTLRVLSGIDGEKCLIPPKYMGKYSGTRESVLLLKNILISDVKHAVANRKTISPSVVEIVNILSEQYRCSLLSTIVTWISNTYMRQYTERLRKSIKKLPDIEKAISIMGEVKEKAQMEYAYLPVWWNVSNAVLMDLGVVVKNRIIEIISTEKFSEQEYLKALEEAISFEKKHLSTLLRKSYREEEEGILGFLETLSKETSLAPEAGHRNVLSSAFVPSIEILIKDTLREIEKKEILFEGGDESELYGVFETIASSLSRLLYFRTPRVFRAFIEIVEEYLSRTIARMGAAKRSVAVFALMDSLEYVEETSISLISKVSSLSSFPVDSSRILREIDGVSERAYDMLLDSLSHETKKIPGLREMRDTEALRRKISEEVEIIGGCRRKREILSRYADALGEILFRGIAEMRMNKERAAEILTQISSVENLFMWAEEKMGAVKKPTMITIIKIYLKVFLVDPREEKLFVDNFRSISRGLFSFEQVVRNLENRRANTSLMEEYLRGREA
jgi:hypothetical protein